MTYVMAAYEIEYAKRIRKDQWIKTVVVVLENIEFKKDSNPITDYIDELLKEAKGGFKE